jgi:hypothetical protein
LLSPSDYHWVNYDEEKLDRVFFTRQAAKRGAELHLFAQDAIRLGIRLPEVEKTLNLYVNDAIGFRMTPEQILYYTTNCYGTADAIGFRRNTLRIHDLKTGTTPSSMTQLEIYVALFCLEYKMRPYEFETELRIYQNDAVVTHVPDPDAIFHIMDRIVFFDKRISYLRTEDQT